MPLRRLLARTAIVSLTAATLLSGPARAVGEADAVSAMVEEIRSGARSEVDGAKILAADFIGRFYDQRLGQPAWFGTGAAKDLLAELRQALTQGLLAEDFHLQRLVDLHAAAESGGPDDVAAFDVLATEAAALLVHHIIFGKVDPETLDPDFNFDRPVIEQDAAAVFNSYLDGEGFSALMNELAIGDSQYLKIIGALATYLEIEELGGWPVIPEGGALKPGTADPRVPLLRERLATVGDLPLAALKAAETAAAEAAAAAVAEAQAAKKAEEAEAEAIADAVADASADPGSDSEVGSDTEAQVTNADDVVEAEAEAEAETEAAADASTSESADAGGEAETEQAETAIAYDPNLYDPDLVAAVERFQNRHGLAADGVIGPQTLAELNHTAGQRADQLRLSLERFRWFVRELEDDYVLVNIGGPEMVLVLDSEVAWRTRTITGSAYRQTPVFRDNIQYMEFNPTWSVPASIFRKDKLARIRKDRGYLERNHYVVRNSSGKVIPASSVNWGADNPGVSLMQTPGPHNALGLVKFMFPNKYAVYLHDTNDRSLFERAERNVSSGCVRVEDPFVFAGLLMSDDPTWTQERMNDILESGKTTRVELPKPMPVLLTYWTAWVQDGAVHFRDDIYERDARLLEALDAPL